LMIVHAAGDDFTPLIAGPHPKNHAVKKYIAAFSLSVGLVIFLAAAFLALPVTFSTWAKNCGPSCFPDKSTCDCTCFDGINKGPYGRGHYKYIYYNSEKQTFLIFSIVAFYIIAGQNAFLRIAKLSLSGKLSLTAFIAFAATVWPNFYAANMHFNYINDNIHHLHFHQTYFSITEFLIALCVIMMTDKRQTGYDQPHTMLWICYSFVVTHIVQNLKDQSYSHLFLGNDSFHDLIPARDLSFLVCDIILLVYFMYKLEFLPKITQIIRGRLDKKQPELDSFKRKLVWSTIGAVVSVFILSTVTFGG